MLSSTSLPLSLCAVDSVVVELVEVPPPLLNKLSDVSHSSFRDLQQIVAAGEARDFSISKDILCTGKVIGTSGKVRIAQLLRAPGLQAVQSVPLTLPLVLTTLPASTLAAVERCLVLGPPPPPPAPAPEAKKGGAASVAVTTAAAPIAVAVGTGTLAVTNLPPPVSRTGRCTIETTTKQ